MVDPVLFKLAISQTRDYAMFLLDREGKVLTWNVGAHRLKGYSAEEIIGRHFSIFYTREAVDRRWPDHEITVATAEGRFEDEGWRVRKDGTQFWANVIITALRDDDGHLLGFSKITRDLTERKRHEETLRQSEERFRLLVDGVLDYAIYMLDPEGVISSWNAGAQRLKGYRPDEVIGRHFSRFFTPEDIEKGAPWEELAQARRTGRCESEGWRLKKDGERFWARTVVTALHDAEGRLYGFAKVTQDLSERRHMQDLEKATRNVNEFIAVLAHELRNPLAPIRHAAEVIAKLPPDDPRRELMRQTIARQTDQLTRIVDDLLDIARITRGELAITRERVDLNDIARRAAETSAPLMEAAHHRFELDVAPEPLYVRGDEHRLAQLVSNLLTNAARYTPDGGTVTLTTRADGRRAVLTVADTGQGIEPELIERIFDMFVHGRALSTRGGGGLGIGLALARRLADAHDGTLTAKSEGRNRGTELRLELPISPRARASQSRHGPTKVAEAPQRRVLVVDDNVDAASTLSLLLDSLGHRTRVAHDGPQALQAALDFKPEVVLLDIGLPGMDGYEVARRLRAQSSEAFRIVALTGWGQDRDRQRAREAGFDMHLVKPVDVVQLGEALAQRHGQTLH